jgi:uncharacterized membrane protein
VNWTAFFYDNFISGWARPESYNWVDTSAYAILALVLVYITYKIIGNKIRFNYETVFNVLPFIILGCVVRVFADYGVYPRFFLTVTPGIWIVILSLVVITILLDYLFKSKGLITFITPLVLILPHIFFMRVVNNTAVPLFALFYLLSLAPFILLKSRVKLFSEPFNLLVIASHLFDATSSFVNVDFFNYVEIHVLGSFFAGLFNTGASMYLVKLLVLPILYYVDKEEDTNFKNYLKLIICVLGLGPGIRNLITVLLGV